MYSREALADVFERILQFETEARAVYEGCIEKLDDETTINILQSISNEEKGHMELAKRLIELIEE